MIEVNSVSSTPPYEQIRSQFAQQIADGGLPVGTRIPTVRQLARDLGLAVNTVARAYRELETAGVVETRGRAGTFVSAQGDRSRERLYAAAVEYAALSRALGVSAPEAQAAVRTALTLTASPSTTDAVAPG